MDHLSKLAQYFREFPGIGPRQAQRFVYFLLTRNTAYLDELSRLITEIKKSIRVCTDCFRFYPSTESSEKCSLCRNPHRDTHILMIVSRDVDLEAIEKSKVYSGYYFVLGGTVPILEKEPEKRIRLNELMKRVERGQFSEIILSLNANAEGEHTADILREYLEKIPQHTYTISVLGRGLSTGTELEYSDSDTIKSALKNRERV